MDEKVVQQIAAEAAAKVCIEADLAARVVQFTCAQIAAYKLANPVEEKVA